MRLFFALPCPPQTAARIIPWRNQLALDGKPISAADLHVTLTFLGTQPEAKLPQLLQVAASIKASAFSLQLDKSGCWPGGLLHLTSGNPPGPLLSLASQLQQKLDAAGFDLEQREYLPHLTLVRNCSTALADAPPLFDWEADEFALYRSAAQPNGVRYTALARWKLQ